MTRALAPFIVFILLGACSGDPLKAPPGLKVVYLPGELRSCVPKETPEEPEYPDTDAALKAAPNAASRYQLVTAGRGLRIARAGVTEPLLRGCR